MTMERKSAVFKGYDLGHLLDDVEEPDRRQERHQAIDNFEKVVLAKAKVEVDLVGKSRVKRKTRVIFKDDACGFSGSELHQLYGRKSPGASAIAGTPFDPARYRRPH